MIDRFGNKIDVAWPTHHILWVEAAMSLSQTARVQAFQDIADLTGRSYIAVYEKHRYIKRKRAEAEDRERRPAQQTRPPAAPAVSAISIPTQAQLMGSGRTPARARRVAA